MDTDAAMIYHLTVWWMPLLVFIVALVACHFVFVSSRCHLDLNYGWKIVDYIWLAMSFVGIIGLISQSRQTVYSGLVALASDRIGYRIADLESHIEAASNFSCEPLKKDIYSPPDFEERERQKKEYCSYLKDVQQTVGPVFAEKKEVENDFLKIQASH
jgi:hypothetical protein